MYEDTKSLPLRSAGALFFLLCAFIGFESGVSVTERPDLATGGHFAKAYYSLSLFVMGGVDLGIPTREPLAGRVLVWLAYFGAPILAVSTLIEALLRALAPQSWMLRRLRNHVIVAGESDLALSYVRVLREHNPGLTIVVATAARDRLLQEEFRQSFGAKVVQGDITRAYFLRDLRVEHANRIILLSENSVLSYEAATLLTNMVPDIGPRIIIHCRNLRFMRAMASTRASVFARQLGEEHNIVSVSSSDLVEENIPRSWIEMQPSTPPEQPETSEATP